MRRIGVVVVLALIVAGCGGSSPQTTTKTVIKTQSVTTTTASTTNTTANIPDGGPVPTGFEPTSFTAISDSNWWLIGQAPCASKPCTSIVRTENGGASFVGLPAPRTSQVSQIRFANPQDGYAYGPELWYTTDGGEDWAQIGSGAESVSELEISGGYAYAVVAPTNGQSILERFPVGSAVGDTLPVAGHPIGGLWVEGSTVIVDSNSNSASENEMLISDNNGQSFQHFAPPPSVACDFEAPDPAVIWAKCATGTLSGVWRSTDGGAQWQSGGQGLGPGLPSEPNSAAFGAASGETAVYGYQQLYRTIDAGGTWAKVPTPSGVSFWDYIAFTDPLHGVALGQFGSGDYRLYYTTNGGASYQLIPIG